MDDKNDFSAAINKFATKFHCVNHSQDGKPKNSVSSGLSAELVLALLTLGTEGETHSELLAAMNLPDDDVLRSIFAGVSAKLKEAQGVTLSIANKVYVQDGDYQLKPEFREDAEKVFGAEVEKIDFASSSSAAERINSWVSNKTHQKIKNVVSPDSFNKDTMAVLVNAIYFKGFWASKFDPKATREKDFHITKDQKRRIPMMLALKHVSYGICEVLDSQFLELEYEGGDASLLIVLPNRIDGLPELMSQISQHPELIDKPQLRKMNVEITIPKFRIEGELNLKSFLPKMGISKIFGPNITKVVDSPSPLLVSQAVQKVFIEVNEKGAEAAAVTVVVMVAKSGFGRPLPVNSIEFRATHPFFYTLRVKGHDLFVGTFEGEMGEKKESLSWRRFWFANDK